MTVAELIERLRGLPADAQVLAYDPSFKVDMPVTGFVAEMPSWSERCHHPERRGTVTLLTDQPF